MTDGVDWLAFARQRDTGTAHSIDNVLWLMGSPASDLWPEKRHARRVLLRVVALRVAHESTVQDHPGRLKPGDRVRVTFETTIIRPVGGKDDDLLYVRNPAGDLPAIVHEDWLTLLVEPERDQPNRSE